jgi:hypothetical protein
MSALKLHTLKQKLWAIVAASFVARVVVFFALPDTHTSLAPDEVTYASLAKWISESRPATDFPNFAEVLYLSGRSLVIPAVILIKIGVSELDAVRLTSSIYGFLALCALAYLCSKFLQIPLFSNQGNKKIQRLVVALFFLYAFLPSHFLWSNLGLRESPNEFWVIMVFIGVFLLYRESYSKKPLLAVLIFISIVCTFSSRPQVGWVLVATLLTYSFFKLRNRLTYLLIVSVLTGLFAGHLVTSSARMITIDRYVAKEVTPTPTQEVTPTPTQEVTPTPTQEVTPTPTQEVTPTPTQEVTPTPTQDVTPRNAGEVEASKLCNQANVQVEYNDVIYNCVKSGVTAKKELPSNLAKVAIQQVAVIPEKQVGNQVGAASAISPTSCPWKESSGIGKYGCILLRAPYMTLTFLFRPLPFIDTTSVSSSFAAAENVIWIFMFMLIVYRISKIRRIPYFGELAPALIFFSLYVVGAASYEGNMGTAFRHKSLILWVVLLLLFAVFWRGQDEAKEPQGNNSQESAV